MTKAVGEMAALLDLAEEMYRSRDFDAAVRQCNMVLTGDPENLEAIFLLANVAYARSYWQEAVRLYRQACRLAPEIGFLQINHAMALMENQEFEAAMAAFGAAEQAGERSVLLYYNRGILLQRLQKFAEARQQFEQTLALEPGHIGAWTNLTAVCLEMNDADGALHCCQHALTLDPDNAALTGNLATAYSKLFRFEESLVSYQRLLGLVSADEQAEVLGRMANCYTDNWQVDLGIACFDRAIAASCDYQQQRALASTRLFVLHYSSYWSAQAIATEHRHWGERYFPPPPSQRFENVPDPDRQIRVAYLSPDLRIHAVIFFLQPVLAAHDPTQIAVYCYSDVKKPDAVTRQIRESHNVIWRDCVGKDDETLMRMLRDDQIDILVDLAGHTAENRLPLFARRGAPVQITWIGYPNTTGLSQMDYRITDGWADPPGMAEQLHTERLLRLPNSFLCYRPGGDFPEPVPPPCDQNGFITFGSFSNFKKVTVAMLELWAQILSRVPGARLVFRARGVTHERFVRDIAPIFAMHQVEPERVIVLGHASSVVENLRDYHRIDIALDTFPYNGTTTTCESLCMEVPVVTLAGDSHVARVGCSLLETVGLPQLICRSEEEYIAVAVQLAHDRQWLASLRSGLRQRLLNSPLTDNIRFVHHLEQLYRQVWQAWCRAGRQ